MAQPPRFDLLIRNGEIRDPGRGVRRRADLAISGNTIAAIEDSIATETAREVIDARDLLVTPGLIDLHTHCYHGATALGIEADPVAARSGVTTWVDAGSFSHDQTAGFRRFVIEPSHSRIFGYVYCYPNNRNPDHDPVDYVRRQGRELARTVDRNRDILLGVKIQVGSNMSGKHSAGIFAAARDVCDQFRLPMMAHISFAPPDTDEVMDRMKPGDVITHCYNNHTLGIFDASGKVRSSVRRARERGVWFDIGHGLGSFNFEKARLAIEQGFLADTISTDIYNLNVNGPVYDLPTTMTKMLALGVPLDEVLVRVTATPAKIIDRIPGHGTLAPGAPADVALLKLEDGEFRLVDSQKNVRVVRQRVACRLAICRGRIMHSVTRG